MVTAWAYVRVRCFSKHTSRSMNPQEKHPTEVPVGTQGCNPCWLCGCPDPSPPHSSAHDEVETVAQACRSFCLNFGHPVTFFHGRMLSEPKCLTESGNSQLFAGSHQFGESTEFVTLSVWDPKWRHFYLKKLIRSAPVKKGRGEEKFKKKSFPGLIISCA